MIWWLFMFGGVGGVVALWLLLTAVILHGRDLHVRIAEETRHRRPLAPLAPLAPCRVSLAEQWCAVHDSTLVSTCRVELARLRERAKAGR